tara:strand:+ start:835 stop:1047 length:213 start_codon:yes stop_codon:yes gene_type:complete
MLEQVDFLEETAQVIVSSVKLNDVMVGWAVSRNGKVLHRARGGVRIFKTLCSVSALCIENNISSFLVEEI